MIFFDHLAFNQVHGGVPKYFTKLFEHLQRSGVEFILSIYFTNNVDVKIFLDSFSELNFFKRIPGYVRILRILGYVYSIVIFLINRNIIKIYHPTHYSFYLFPWVYLFAPNVKIVSTVHDMNNWTISKYYPRIDIRRFRQYMVMRLSHKLICVSQSTANDILTYFPQWKDKLFVIEHGVSFPIDFSPSVRSKSVLYVGARNNYKGFDEVLLSLSSMDISIRPVLWIVGGLLNNREKSMLKSLNIEYVLMRGCSDEKLQQLYRSCGCFIYPSFGEGFGLPLLDAYSQGAVVIGRDIPVFRELLRNEMVYFRTQEDLVRIYWDVFEKDRFKTYTETKNVEILRKYTWENSGNSHVKLYMNLW